MDIFAHAAYGATVFSKKGIAGGKTGQGAAHHWFRESTVWVAILFGMLPDVVSMWPAYAIHWWSDAQGNFFANVGETTLIHYRVTHSLVVALPCCVLTGLWRKSFFIPSLAWPLHSIMDAFTHGIDKFQGIPFYPVLDLRVPGISWWKYPGLIAAYWGVLVLTWIGLWMWRRNFHHKIVHRKH